MILTYRYYMRTEFSAPVTRHYYSLRCVPRDTMRQRVRETKLEILPSNSPRRYTDARGGIVVYGEIMERHTDFTAALSGTVETGLAVNEHFDTDTDIYRVQSRLTVPGAEIAALYARLRRGAPKTPYERVLYFTRSVYDTISYVPSVTDVGTSAEYAVTKRCGVCQDFAHILISLLRIDGIPVRYVVGMTVGEGASHAWTEVNLNGYWYGLDPTNNALVDGNYIKISHGRDYYDCAVSKGVFFGAARQRQTVKVTVEERIVK